MADTDDSGIDSLNPLVGPVRPATFPADGSAKGKDFAGEQSMGFYWGERGYFLVEGPSGAGGHRANDKGFDGVAYNPATGHLVIYDNKAFKDAGNVYSATAITKNFAKNLDGLIGFQLPTIPTSSAASAIGRMLNRKNRL